MGNKLLGNCTQSKMDEKFSGRLETCPGLRLSEEMNQEPGQPAAPAKSERRGFAAAKIPAHFFPNALCRGLACYLR